VLFLRILEVGTNLDGYLNASLYTRPTLMTGQITYGYPTLGLHPLLSMRVILGNTPTVITIHLMQLIVL
jgi:hypothetical protein